MQGDESSQFSSCHAKDGFGAWVHDVFKAVKPLKEIISSAPSMPARRRASSSTASDTSLFHISARHRQALMFSLTGLTRAFSGSIALMPSIFSLADTPLWSSS